MNLFRTMAAAVLILPSMLWADTQFGYTNGTMTRNTVFRYGNTEKQGLAICLSHDKLQVLQGKTIKSVITAFGAVNQAIDKKATLFITTSLEGKPLMEQEVSVGNRANYWLTFALDAPYVITGQEEALYVGYTMVNATSTINCLQADLTPELRGCSFAYNGSGWDDLFGYGSGNANIKLGLDGDVQLTDVMLKETNLSGIYLKAENDYHYDCDIFNFGTETIQSLEVAVTVNGERSVLTYDNLSVGQMSSHAIQLPVIRSEQPGGMPVSVAVTRVNGQAGADAVLSDNQFDTQAYFYPAKMERNLLVEEFTGADCPNCPSGKVRLESAIHQSGLPCVEVMHHSAYAPDFYSMMADWQYTFFYGQETPVAPAAMVNRLRNPQISSCPVFRVGQSQPAFSEEDALSTLQLAATREPYVSLELNSQFNEATRQLDVTFSARCHKALPGPALFNIYLVQDSVRGYQNNGGTAYIHNGLLRKVFTENDNAWGYLFRDDFTADSTFTWHVSYELPAEGTYSDYWTPSALEERGFTAEIVTVPLDLPHMRIVAYVSGYDPYDYNAHEVYNCLEVPMCGGSYRQGGFDAPMALTQIQCDAQPAAQGVFDLTGRRMSADRQLQRGLYIANGKKVMVCAD